MVVVKVGCSNCGQPLGIALVGMSGSGKATEKAANSLSKAYAKSELDDPPYPADWTKNDIQKFSGASRIGYDDVLDAHQFFSTLPDDWQKLLPKKPKRSGRQLSM